MLLCDKITNNPAPIALMKLRFSCQSNPQLQLTESRQPDIFRFLLDT